MTILVLEDRGAVSFRLRELLQKEKYTVYEAANLYQAEYYYRERQVDAFIVDLNLSPENLTGEEIAETLDGRLSGWIWVRNRVFGAYLEQPEQLKLVRRTVVIYTEYMTELRKQLSEEELEGLRLVEKGSINPSEQVLRHLAEIAGEIERERGE